MNLKRKLLLGVAAVSLPLGLGLFVATTGPAGAATGPTFLGSALAPSDTITCNTLIGTIKISPALTAGTAVPAKIVVAGTLEGCTDSAGAAPFPFFGIVKGVLNGASNSLTSLQGATALSCKHGPTYVKSGANVPCGYDGRVDAGASLTLGQPKVTDAAITVADQGDPISGPGIPPGSYVGTVTPGSPSYFQLSSSPTNPAAAVNATKTLTGIATVTVYGFAPTHVFGTNPYGYMTVQWQKAAKQSALTTPITDYYGGSVVVPECTYGATVPIDNVGDFSSAAGYNPSAYGEFVIGAESVHPPTNPTGGCANGGVVTGDYLGTDNGAGSSMVVLTVNDAVSLLFGQSNVGTTTSVITAGPTVAYIG